MNLPDLQRYLDKTGQHFEAFLDALTTVPVGRRQAEDLAAAIDMLARLTAIQKTIHYLEHATPAPQPDAAPTPPPPDSTTPTPPPAAPNPARELRELLHNINQAHKAFDQSQQKSTPIISTQSPEPTQSTGSTQSIPSIESIPSTPSIPSSPPYSLHPTPHSLSSFSSSPYSLTPTPYSLSSTSRPLSTLRQSSLRTLDTIRALPRYSLKRFAATLARTTFAPDYPTAFNSFLKNLYATAQTITHFLQNRLEGLDLSPYRPHPTALYTYPTYFFPDGPPRDLIPIYLPRPRRRSPLAAASAFDPPPS